jgi:hypothetical protein
MKIRLFQVTQTGIEMNISRIFQRTSAIQTSIEFAENHIQRLEQSKRLIEKQIQVWNKKKENLEKQIKTSQS